VSSRRGMSGDRTLERNAAANVAAAIIIAVVGLVSVPIYIHFLGIGAYALVGFFVAIASFSVLLDLGIYVTVKRELARLSAHPGAEQAMRDLLRTLELFSWLIAIVLGSALSLSADYISEHWLRSNSLPPSSIRGAVLWMGLLLFIQAPIALYASAMIGLQRQVALSILQASASLIRSGGAIVVLWLWSRTIEAFFIWQCIAAIALVTAAATVAWSSLPRGGGRARVTLASVRHLWRFAAGTSGSNLVESCLGYADKFILSQVLSLENFGFYLIGWDLAGKLATLADLVFNALFPRLAQLMTAGDDVALKSAYHRASQLLTILIVPLAANAVAFASPLILLWTRNPTIALNAAPVAELLFIGTALQAVAAAPKALQWSYGRTRPVLCANLLALALMVPSVTYFATMFGGVGGAGSWLAAIATGFMLLTISARHLPDRGQLMTWWREDLLPPVSASLAIVCIWAGLFPIGGSAPVRALTLGASLATTYVGAAASVPTGRAALRRGLELVRLWSRAARVKAREQPLLR
jgi:O-antigen/teichoic acid export membrane protein